MERQSGGLLPKAERCERVNRNEQCDRSKGAVRRLRLRNADRKKAENPHEKQNPGSIDLQCPGESKWRDYRASLARNLNRRDCPPGRSLVSVEKAADELSSTGGHRRLSPRPFQVHGFKSPSFRIAEIRSTRKGHFGFLCRSGGIRTRGLLVPNQTRYQTALHLDTWSR